MYQMEANGTLESLILHEMLHVVGFGVYWAPLSLLVGSGTPDPHFTGAGAVSAFLSFNDGGAYAGNPVPVENTGGGGTAGSHWREAVFGNELMSGWLSGTHQPLSRTSVASLADLGYVVDLSRSDPFSILSPASAASLEPGNRFFLGSDVRPEPPWEVDDHGRPKPR